MNRVILISFGSELEKLLSIINREKTDIVAVITFPIESLYDTINKYNLNCNIFFYDEIPEIVRQKYFDYIITSDIVKDAGTENRFVGELKRVGVPDDKILNMSHFASFPFFSIYNALQNLCNAPISSRLKYKFFVTGVSHAYAGTDIQSFSMPGINLALTSQDLFYDYEFAKIVLESKRSKNPAGEAVEYAIIGAAPFSLNYDLSQGVNSDRAFAYYPVAKTLHNHRLPEKKLLELFNDNYIKSYDLFDTEIKFDGCLRSCTQNKNFTIDDFIDMRKNLMDNKYHSETVAENKKILQNYVADCLNAGVYPLLVIYPLSEFYNKYFSAKKFEELRYFLTDLSKEFGVQFWDFSTDENFSLSDFFDVEHLNVRGAKKFSSILNEKILAFKKETWR